ncbi:MAG: hypothetical protein LBV12_00045 [Puniceicoccales bacterium]|jgi:hypothetical protein|nr:hypothetical protein [Puniceicoccales bacterium]
MTSNLVDPFRTLRETQARAMQEQQLFSGRDWLRVTTFVQLLTAIYPLYLWASFALFSSRAASETRTMEIIQLVAAVTLGIGIILGLLAWWAKYAPFRAAVVAIVFYIALNVFLAICRPEHFLDGAASRILIFLGLVMAVRTGFHRHRAK